jgi:hypothetical protein
MLLIRVSGEEQFLVRLRAVLKLARKVRHCREVRLGIGVLAQGDHHRANLGLRFLLRVRCLSYLSIEALYLLLNADNLAVVILTRVKFTYEGEVDDVAYLPDREIEETPAVREAQFAVQAGEVKYPLAD